MVGLCEGGNEPPGSLRGGRARRIVVLESIYALPARHHSNFLKWESENESDAPPRMRAAVAYGTPLILATSFPPTYPFLIILLVLVFRLRLRRPSDALTLSADLRGYVGHGTWCGQQRNPLPSRRERGLTPQTDEDTRDGAYT
ncbi:hypothetical protein ANN_07903 [Periplaneta americana]|uniref:Uncharacterized protein n=1 Tax=Periplaneta americana TaxID=6978 RepID=A0ABQ8T1G0_PERAM|nr:hypothetical protein ANN_07903 [Periplaneta americana]